MGVEGTALPPQPCLTSPPSIYIFVWEIKINHENLLHVSKMQVIAFQRTTSLIWVDLSPPLPQSTRLSFHAGGALLATARPCYDTPFLNSLKHVSTDFTDTNENLKQLSCYFSLRFSQGPITLISSFRTMNRPRVFTLPPEWNG